MAGKNEGIKGRKTPGGAHHRRIEIVDAALGLFAERGFRGASVREIARAVGVNEATLYHYFPSKAAILDAIIDELLAERREALDVPIDGDVTLGEALKRLAATVLARSQTPRERKLVRLMMIEGPRLAIEGRYPFLRLMRESVQRIHALFDGLIAARKMRRIDSMLAGLEFMAPILIFSQHQHGLGGDTEEPLDPGRFVRSHVDLFVRAFAPDEAAPAARGGRRAGRREKDRR